eukprot:gene10310-12062_t
MSDKDQTIYDHQKFGNIKHYYLIPPNPDFRYTRRLKPPACGRFSAAEWSEFLTYIESCGRKIKASFRDGQILIEESNIHVITESGLNVFSGTFYECNRKSDEWGDDALMAFGKLHYRIAENVLMPDATWAPQHGLHPSVFFEIANLQAPENLLNKVDLILRNSHEIRYVIIVKVWRDPLPDQVAMVIAVWLKANDVIERNEWQATKFTSFGTRPPTSAELAAFPVTPGDRPWLSPLDGVIESSDRVSCDVSTAELSVFTLTLLPVHMFNVPNMNTPAHLLALPDLIVPLYLVKQAMVRGMIVDILNERWLLTDAKCETVLACVDVQQNDQQNATRRRQLYQYSLERVQSVVATG